MAVSKGASKAAEYEYLHWASVTSYLHDATKGLEDQLAAQALDKTSLLVILTHLREVLRKSVQRLDYLKIRGEHLETNRGLVLAAEHTISDATALPITSPELLACINDFRRHTAQQAVRFGASQEARGASAGYPRGGGGRGPRGRGRGRVDFQRGLGPIQTRASSSQGQGSSGGSGE